MVQQDLNTQTQKTDSSHLTPITSILIANRGEIASRVIRTCKKMGIRSIAVFSEADRYAPFVKEADFSVFIGESSPNASYLDQDKIIGVCQKYNVSAIHPGYGFLSENAGFAQKCKDVGIIFIGPHPKAIEEMGSKSNAKAIMKNNEVPTIPGYQGEDQSTETLSNAAKEIGFPVLLKAAAGGGGKGMRIVHEEKELEGAIEAAKREGLNAFGNDELIIEKYIASGRHIEFQIFGDKHGNAIHILERECTIQRRYQKVIEESPSPVLTPELRAKMGEAAVKAAKALDYDNAGTVEFIFDDKTQDFYFLEVNTRLQVEHPVTEEITGLDLVQMQIEVAERQPLSLTQEEVEGKDYAVECRLYAEDAENDFMPATGKIHHWEVPEVDGLRIETAIESGSEISIYYDPMISKLIVWDKTRGGAHRKMSYVLKNLQCLGLTTNQEFLIKLFENQQFNQGKYDTHFLQNEFDFEQIKASSESQTVATIAATLYDWQERESKRKILKHIPSGWRNSFYEHQKEIYLFGEEEFWVKYKYLDNKRFEVIIPSLVQFIENDAVDSVIEDNVIEVQLLEASDNYLAFELGQERYAYHLAKNGNEYFLRNEHLGGITFKLKERFPEAEVEKVKGGYIAPMPSQVVKVLVEVGQKVKTGDGLIVISSMKMENTLAAEEDGTVEEIYASDGENVDAGFLLLKVSSED